MKNKTKTIIVTFKLDNTSELFTINHILKLRLIQVLRNRKLVKLTFSKKLIIDLN